MAPKLLQRSQEVCRDADQGKTDSGSNGSDSSVSESDSDSLYDLAAIEEAELGQETEDLASMPDSTLQIRIFLILEWLEVSLSSLHHCQYAIFCALRRILEATAQSLDNLAIHWLI